MLEIAHESEVSSDKENQAIETKSTTPVFSLNSDELKHCFQSNHIAMLISGVAIKDSTYIQTLTTEDFVSLGITKEEMEFSSVYINELNYNKYGKQ